MNKYVHIVLITFYFTTILATLVVLIGLGQSFYRLPIEERFFDSMYAQLKPSGFLGHGYGIVGTLFIVIGLFSYMIRKHFKLFWGWGGLKYWLEAHIFLCTLGTLLVVFHTSFKFGGIVSVGFWSLIIVWFSGLIGRFIYIQIPRTIEGRTLTLQEITELIDNLEAELNEQTKLEDSKIRSLSRRKRKLQRQVKGLEQMKRIFNRWHYAHLPFALIMLIIMVIHVTVVLYLGYKWIL